MPSDRAMTLLATPWATILPQPTPASCHAAADRRYKAYFRWPHYQLKLRSDALSQLATETDACASVTAAFLQVLHTLHSAEQLRATGQKRSVLQVRLALRAQAFDASLQHNAEIRVLTPPSYPPQLLSTNTRRTKVVELSSGTHRYEALLAHVVHGMQATALEWSRLA